MSKFVPWDSQSLAAWGEKYARGKFVELDGHQTHYIEIGEGAPLILIHGFFYDTHMWDRNMDIFAQHYKVYVMDLWGFGYSTREFLDFGYPLYAQQLKLFMDALGIQKATLIGQSLGGGTIIQFCLKNRDRVDKIVLVDPAALPNKLPLMGRVANLPGVGEIMFGMNSNFMRKMSLKTNFVYNNNYVTDAYVERVTRFQKVVGTTEALLKILRKEFFDTLQAEVHQVATMNIPALVVGGRQDSSVSIELTKEVHRILTGSRLEIIDQAGHCPNDEKAEQFNPVVLDFLSS